MKYIVFAVIASLLLVSPNLYAQEAGKGSYQPLVIKRTGAVDDGLTFNPGVDYIRVEAISWYVNQQGGFFSDRSVSGTIELEVGDEKYQTVLSPYELQGGNRTAPMFNRTILYNRVYPGGNLRIKAFILGFKTDTKFTSLLKSLASVGFDIGMGRVVAATATTAAAPLGNASQLVSESVQTFLKTRENKKDIFTENGGLDFTMPVNITGAENFLFAYRGDPLTPGLVTVADIGGGQLDVKHNGIPVSGGAWVLLRISRESVFGSRRPWSVRKEAAKSDIDALMEDWRVGIRTQAEVTQALTPSINGTAVADKILALRTEVNADLALTTTERARNSGELMSLFGMAREAATANNASLYFQRRDAMTTALTNGTLPPQSVVAAFKTEFENGTRATTTALIRELRVELPTQTASVDNIFATAVTANDLSRIVNSQDFDRFSTARSAKILKNIVATPQPTDVALWKKLSEVTAAEKIQ